MNSQGNTEASTFVTYCFWSCQYYHVTVSQKNFDAIVLQPVKFCVIVSHQLLMITCKCDTSFQFISCPVTLAVHSVIYFYLITINDHLVGVITSGWSSS